MSPLVSLSTVQSGDFPVHIITLKNSRKAKGGYENKLSTEFCKEFMAVLDEVEKIGGKGAVVTVADADGGATRHYSNGLDLDDLMADVSKASAFLDVVQRLFHKILVFPMPTIAAINGHAFAGGWLLALAHDHRVMTTDRGLACMTEVDLGFPLTPGFNSLLLAKMPRYLAARMMLEAVRLDANELAKHNVVTCAVPTAQVLDTAVALGGKLASKAGAPILRQIKEDLYTQACIDLIDTPNQRNDLVYKNAAKL